MNNRLKAVEKVICDHLSLLLKISEPQDAEAPEFKFIFGLPTVTKMEVLKLNHVLFDKHLDYLYKENRKITIFRMKGMNQSYNMLDSQVFRDQNETMKQLLLTKEKDDKKKGKVTWDENDSSDGHDLMKVKQFKSDKKSSSKITIANSDYD